MRTMKKILFILFFASTFALDTNGQCLSNNFSVNPVCGNDTVIINSNTPANFTNYEWDFCSGELGLDSLVRSSLSPFSSGFTVNSTKIVSDGSNWFMFVLASSNILYRLDFGNDLTNTPILQNLGSPGGANTPYSIDFVNENNNWFALVTYNTSLRLLNFGNTLTNTPVTSAITLPTGTLLNPRGITLARDNNTLIALIVGNTNNRLRLIRFGASILNTVTTADTLSVPHLLGSGAYNIAITKDCKSNKLRNNIV